MLALLAQSGVHGDDAGKDVGMVHAGSYTTAKDPRMNLEARRVGAPVSALSGLGKYEAVYYNQIAYNTLLSRIEAMAQSDRYKTKASFVKAATQYLSDLGSSSRLPLSQEDIELGRQLHLPMTRIAGKALIKTQFSEMIDNGIEIKGSVIDTVNPRLEEYWDSWHPKGKP